MQKINMVSLILIGLLSGLFFSSTFILNRVMSLEGGHWLWSAFLQYKKSTHPKFHMLLAHTNKFLLKSLKTVF